MLGGAATIATANRTSPRAPRLRVGATVLRPEAARELINSLRIRFKSPACRCWDGFDVMPEEVRIVFGAVVLQHRALIDPPIALDAAPAWW